MIKAMEEILSDVVLTLYVPLNGGVSLIGLVANIINTIVFSRQGVQDSASLSLLLLSVCDLGVCLTSLLYAVCYSVERLAPNQDVAVYDLSLPLSALPRMLFCELSMCTTVVMSMERCLCVARPLTFKTIINRRNSIILLAVLYTEVFCTFVTQLVSYPMSWQWDSGTNTTRWKLVLGNGSESLPVTVHKLLNNVILTTLSILVVVVCTCVMVGGLRASGRFRHAVKSTDTHSNLATPTSHSNLATPTSHSNPTLSGKEARLVKMVTLVSIIFLACHAPVMVTLVVKKLVPDLNMYGRYASLNDILWAFLYLTAAINASATICVYLTTSTHYNKYFHQLFVGGKK